MTGEPLRFCPIIDTFFVAAVFTPGDIGFGIDINHAAVAYFALYHLALLFFQCFDITKTQVINKLFQQFFVFAVQKTPA